MKKQLENFFNKININLIDRYIISRFLSSFVFILSLIMAIIVVIDIQEKLDDFMQPAVTMHEIIVYFLCLIPYYAVLLTPLFIFITVIFFTSKLAARSEIIAIHAAGMSLDRLLKPYMISACILSLISFAFSSSILPKLNRHRIDFQNQYVSNKKRLQDEHLQVELSPGIFAYFGQFNANDNIGRNFSLEQFDGNTLISRLTAESIVYDSINHWTIRNYRVRNFEGLYEHTLSGTEIDTLLMINPEELLISQDDQELMTNSELNRYIEQQKRRGLANIQNFQIEYHKRYASLLAAFILTIIGLSLSARKVKGGIGFNIALGLVLTFTYIFLFMLSATYATNSSLSPFFAAWLPNIIYLPICLFLFYRARK